MQVRCFQCGSFIRLDDDLKVRRECFLLCLGCSRSIKAKSQREVVREFLDELYSGYPIEIKTPEG